MPRSFRLRRNIPLAAGLLGVALAPGSQTTSAKIEHPVATPYHIDDPDMASFTLKFDIRLRNRSDKAVNFPKSESPGGRTTRVSIIAGQSKQSDGSWKYLFQSTWVDDGRTKYEPCTSLPPGAVVRIANVKGGLLLLKSQVADLGDEPTLRFDLWIFCRQPDEKVVITSVTSDPFILRLPAHPPERETSQGKPEHD